MTAQRKLFVAAALVAAGFGVATLIGKPHAEMPAPQSAEAELPQQFIKSQAATPPSTTGTLRLVPDYATVNSTKGDARQLIEVAPPLLLSTPPQLNELAVAAPSLNLHKPAPSNLSPRAKLRNEAPRPLAIESRMPVELPYATSTNAPPANHVSPPSATFSQPGDGLAQSSFEQGPVPAPVISALYNNVLDSTAIVPPVIPPPWPAPEEDEGPRKHVVIDGDSLARLAGRYLDDPRRGGEIFEANRGVLSDPDLLPIGTELVIPNRSSTAAFNGNSPQSFVPSAVAIHSAGFGRLVPVRPIPASAGVVPRAQLSRPMPVE